MDLAVVRVRDGDLDGAVVGHVLADVERGQGHLVHGHLHGDVHRILEAESVT